MDEVVGIVDDRNEISQINEYSGDDREEQDCKLTT